MTGQTELADHIAWSRARAATALAIAFVTTQAVNFNDTSALSRPSTLHLVAWIGWALMLLFFLAATGGLFCGERIRALLNDETTIHHRREAMVFGFWGAMTAAFVSYGVAFYEPLSAQQTARAVITAAIVIALLRFGTLERRALKNG